MAVRTALLTSRNINLDTDFSKYIETVSEPGVITGFAVTASAVGTGQAWVPCERTNGETIYAFVQNFNSVAISGDGYVIISIPQNIIDNGGGNEDGTGIATIEVVNELPAKNYLQLATISSGTVTDTRNMIPTVGELKTDVNSLFASVEDLDTRVDALEAAAAIDHLEERALVGEKYALTDTLFKQITPTLANSTVEANVGDTAANTEIHIQRQGSGTASNKLKIKIKKTGSPADLVVQVRKGIEVDVSSSEAYWYGDSENIIATGSVTASTITTSFQELEITLDAEFGGTEGELLDIVLKQNGSVNASNYYVIACDSTQRSEGFSFVSVNGSTRSRSKLMPYCISDGFAQFMLSKVSSLEKTTKLYEFSGSQYVNKNWNTTINVNVSSYDKVIADIDITNNPGYLFTIRTSFNGSSNYYDVSAAPSFKGVVNFTEQIEATLTTLSTLYFNNGSNQFTVTGKLIYYGITLASLTGYRKALPRESKYIGEKATATLFGYHTNGQRRDGN